MRRHRHAAQHDGDRMTFVSARGAVLVAGCIVIAACVHTKARPTASTLRDAYAGAFLVGTAVNEAIVSGADAAARDLTTQQFNTITADNVLKAARLNPTRGVWNFAPADAFVAFGETQKMNKDGFMLKPYLCGRFVLMGMTDG